MNGTELSNFFNFDEGDLAANRAGKLTEKQKKRLESEEKGGDSILYGLSLLMFAMAIGFTIVVPRAEYLKLFSSGRLDTNGWTTIIGGGFLPLLICGGLGYFFFKVAKDKTDYSVKKAEDKVNFVKVEERVKHGSKYVTEELYELRVGKHGFEDVDEELLNLIEEGDIYAFYYTNDTHEILSCEFIKKGK